ncbi:23S rRNA (pseudouridine(1915)-N(3))-methyltransferase RlmH [Streptococcus dysgalactiae subsp. equisimilis]|mgnify:FL=1|uniref:Ribosomal RNA large subunit methyltransferase H n=3 Tax=Streptococcus dysgalactiae TaxID=1334 RepID=A0A9X8T782_STREQ|nr:MULTISPECIES: 23S rRNA (pseudouridine(1915)-N(3))-methyltransferase RlmH [Streptococcus]ADX25610.1 rRNA large subunit methyltransferase [Streptococcus dysgalactiae subsp. equisimilis ATCC 12394]EGL47972.1 rRNA large subunit m3Psi methyltransferase RlmH [Streptococcus dysgalactiae subsp. equisimilis SK1249]EGR87864.1 rRNA large subunit m3Psi methyltransferase RlmH [Streptococcus dysgalactiae subsp. equisimilis SK1250]BAN94662.1 rRNA large subunit methyltransferase [Streptococcus dysgalactiae 
MKVKLICVGKLKERYLKDGISEYQKRLSRFCQFEMIELTDERTPDKASDAENQMIMAKEAQRIEKKIGQRDFVVVLAIEGKQFPSETFSQLISETTVKGYSDITFIIGGSLGLDPRIKKRANVLMSFGLLTLPHQLMRLVLIEQIYRAFMIAQGSPYHK